MIVGQNTLLNQYVPTFYIKNITDGQILIYDSVRKAFINSDNIGGGGSATRLGELEDVSPTVDNPLSLQNGQALVYNSFTSLWENSFTDYNTLLNKPVIPTNSSFSFAGLSDTAKPSLPNGYVLWNSAGSQLVYSTTIPVSSIQGLAPVATAGTLGSLTNVSPTSDALNNISDIGKTLSWNGTTWIPVNPQMRVVATLSARDALTPTLGNQVYVVNSDDGQGDYVNAWSLWIYTISGPSNGWTLLSRQQSSGGECSTIEYTIADNSPAVITVGTLPTGGRITLITIEVISPFSGTPSLEIGYTIENPSMPSPVPDGLMSTSEIDLTTVGTYSTISDILFGTDTLPGDVAITANYVAGIPGTGSAQIIVSYV